MFIEAIIALVAVIVFLIIATQRFYIPYPVVLVVGGLLLGLIPDLPQIHLDPDVIFLLFVPPVLSAAGFFVSARDVLKHIRSISLLAIAQIIITTFAVAFVFKWLMPDMPWAVGCVLGAIIAPPDAAAATIIMRRLQVPRRIIAILEGESLFNDGSALIIYRFAVVATATGIFSFPKALASFFLVGLGGGLLGLLLGWLLVQLIKRVDDVIIAITISLLMPFITYIIAEKLQVSGILAVVIMGAVLGWYDPEIMSAKKRLKGSAVWETMIFLLNSMAFALMGLQFPFIMKDLSGWPYSKLLGLSLAILAVVVVIRFVGVFFIAYIVQAIFPKIRKRDPYPPWRQVIVIAWAGMRGIVSLGAALALPLMTNHGANFPARPLIIFLTFTTIIGTLVLQGISLPFLTQWLGLKEDAKLTHEKQRLRETIAKSMMAEVDRLKSTGAISQSAYEVAKGYNTLYMNSLLSDAVEQEAKYCAKEINSVRHKMLLAGRHHLLQLHRHHSISEEVMQAIQHELDLEELHYSDL